MKEVNVLISKSVEQQGTSPRATQRQNDNIDREVVCKILEGDPDGAASIIKIKIGNERGSRTKRILEDSASAEQLLSVDLKKPRLMPFYSSTPCSREKHSSADSDCFLGSLGSLNETTADAVFHNHQVFLKSKQDVPELDIDLDDSLLDPSDNEKEDSPFRMTEDEISSLLDDNLVAGDVEKYAIEISSPKYSYWHERNQQTETSASRLSPVKNNILESDSENPGEWATSMIILSECGATPSRTEASERKHEYQREPEAEVHLKSRKVVNLPFDLDIDELLALSPIDVSTVDHGDELALGEEEHYLSKDCKSPVGIDDLLDDAIVSKPKGKTNRQEVLFKVDENNSKGNSCQAVAAIKPSEEQPVHLPVLVEQPLSCGQTVQSEKPKKTEENNFVSSTNLTKNIRPVTLVPSCILDSHLSSGKDSSSAQKLTAFLLQLNKPMNVSGPLPASGGSSSSSGALDSKNVESNNTDVAKSPLMTQSNTAVENGKNHVSPKDSTKVLPPVKKLGKVAPLPKKETRHESVPHAELEWKKQTYLQCVLKHMRSTEQPNQDAYDELLMLMDQVASAEYKNQEQNWQHPSDLTTRNYPRFAKKLPNKYSLKQWVSQNGGYYRRFQNLADHFQRSPVVVYSSI